MKTRSTIDISKARISFGEGVECWVRLEGSAQSLSFIGSREDFKTLRIAIDKMLGG